MPASFEFDPSDPVVYSRAWGVLTDEDIAANRAAMAGHPDFHARLSQLYDFTAVTDLKITPAGVRALAATSPFARDARRAIVVAHDVAFGMARMYALLADRDDTRFRIFRTRADAVAWLHLEPPAPGAAGHDP